MKQAVSFYSPTPSMHICRGLVSDLPRQPRDGAHSNRHAVNCSQPFSYSNATTLPQHRSSTVDLTPRHQALNSGRRLYLKDNAGAPHTRLTCHLCGCNRRCMTCMRRLASSASPALPEKHLTSAGCSLLYAADFTRFQNRIWYCVGVG